MVFVDVVTLLILEVEGAQEGTDVRHGRACSNCELCHDRHHSLLWKNCSQATYNKNYNGRPKKIANCKKVLMELETGQLG
jgi:hypothetical protein